MKTQTRGRLGLTFVLATAGMVIGNVSLADEAGQPPYFTAAAGVGTTGIGGQVAWRFVNHFGLRVAGDYFSYSRSGEIEGVNYNAKLRLSGEPVTVDWYPWRSRSFRLSLGARFNQNRLRGTGTGGNIELDGTTYTPAEYGSLSMVVKQNTVNPYLALGGTLFHFDSRHRWGMTGEIGVFYTGNPKVDLSTTGSVAGLAASLDAEEGQLESKAKDFKFWPVLKIAVEYKF